jgi:sigma-B regulation protein RsbU (phosphoserine phosphatase)
LLKDLFEPMIRGSHDNAELRSVGLGLFIVREIARAHYGEVAVTSSLTSGTTFTATFPRALISLD